MHILLSFEQFSLLLLTICIALAVVHKLMGSHGLLTQRSLPQLKFICDKNKCVSAQGTSLDLQQQEIGLAYSELNIY